MAGGRVPCPSTFHIKDLRQQSRPDTVAKTTMIPRRQLPLLTEEQPLTFDLVL